MGTKMENGKEMKSQVGFLASWIDAKQERLDTKL
jgi:hypothetical protein